MTLSTAVFLIVPEKSLFLLPQKKQVTSETKGQLYLTWPHAGRSMLFILQERSVT